MSLIFVITSQENVVENSHTPSERKSKRFGHQMETQY